MNHRVNLDRTSEGQHGGVHGRLLQIILVIAALAIATWLVLDREPVVESGKSVASPLPAGWSARIVEIERIGPAGDFTLRRRDGNWFMENPVEDLASKTMVRELLRSLEKITPERILAESNLSDFGLEPPQTRILLRTYSDQEIELRIGWQAPVSEGVYIQWTGMETVGLISPRSVLQYSDSLISPAYKWRELELLPPHNSAIDSIHVRWPHESMHLTRLGQEHWAITEPAGKVAEDLSCERTVAGFWRFRFNRFFTEKEATLDLGLDQPAARWIIYRGGLVDTLDIGRKISDTLMAVRLQGRFAGEVRADLYDFLTDGIHKFEICHLFEGESGDVEQFAVTYGEKGRVYRKFAGKWKSRELAVQEFVNAAVGTPPEEESALWAEVVDPTINGDLQNLFWHKGDRWLTELPGKDKFAELHYTVHLWDKAKNHQWAYISGDPTLDITSFSCQALGSRFPQKSIEFDSAKSIWRMLQRLEKKRK